MSVIHTYKDLTREELKWYPAKDATICQLILVLYRKAVERNDLAQLKLLKYVYIKAKKMNRKLHENKFGKLPRIKGNSWKEEDWLQDLEELEGLVRRYYDMPTVR